MPVFIDNRKPTNCNMKLTLRKLIKLVQENSAEDLIKCLSRQDKFSLSEPVPISVIKAAFTDVMTELLSKPKTRAYAMPIVVRKNDLDPEASPEVLFLNRRYQAPPVGLLPLGGKNPPLGRYNINLHKYNQYYGFGWTPWSLIIDTPIIDECKLAAPELLSVILWGITVNGWTEDECLQTNKLLEARLLQALKEV